MARKRKSWWKKDLKGQLKWFANFVDKLPKYKEILKITDEEMESVINDEANFRYYNKTEAEIIHFRKIYTAYRKNLLNGKGGKKIGKGPKLKIDEQPIEVMPGIVKRTFNFVVSLKNRTVLNLPAYEALDIIGDDIAWIPEDKYHANVVAKFLLDKVKLTYVKGQIDRMDFFCQRGDDPEFVEFGSASKGFRYDKRPNLNDEEFEIRRYQSRAMIKDEFFGYPSPIVEIVFRTPPKIKNEDTKIEE